MQFNQVNQNKGNVVNTGTLQSVDCPHCGKFIRHPLRNALVSDEGVSQHSAPCPHCCKLVHYEARWELQVTAGKERIH